MCKCDIWLAIVFSTYTYNFQLLEEMNCSSKVDVFALGLILCELCIVMTEDQAEEVAEDILQHQEILLNGSENIF